MKIKRLIDGVEKLNLSNRNIKDILDLEDLYGLKEIDCSNNEITQIINIPISLKYLNCSNNKIILLTDLPYDLTCLKCKNNPLEVLHYTINVKPNKYPSNIKKIIFDYNFNQPIDNLPSNSLVEIYFIESSQFNHPINNLPNSLKILTLGNKFNHPINYLPMLETLTLGNNFNNSLDYLPNSLTHLTIGRGCLKYFGASCKFNHQIDNLPNSLIELIFSDECIFQKSITNLPNSLKKIRLSGYYNSSINNMTDSIETIVLGPTWLKYNEKTYHPLCLKNIINKLPKSLKHMYYIDYYLHEDFIELDFKDLKTLNKYLENSYNNPYTFEYYMNYSGAKFD